MKHMKDKIILPGEQEISVDRLKELLESQGFSLNENKMSSFEEFLFESKKKFFFDKFSEETNI